MKKKVIIVIAFIIVAVLLIVIAFMIDNNIDNEKNKENLNLCEQIDKSKKQKENFIVILKNKYNINGDTNDAINKFKEEYGNNIIHEVELSSMNDDCIKKSLEDSGAYDLIKENGIPTIIGYKSGNYSGLIQNVLNFYEIEKFLVERDIITKKQIKENITYEDYKENIEEKEYLLLVVNEEEVRIETSNIMKKVFPNLKQNTVNKRSVLGEKILKDLEAKTKVLNVYPQVFYFKEGKVVGNDKVFSEKSFNTFKTEVVDIQKN